MTTTNPTAYSDARRQEHLDSKLLPSLWQERRRVEGEIMRLMVRRLWRRYPVVGTSYKYKPYEKIREDEAIDSMQDQAAYLRLQVLDHMFSNHTKIWGNHAPSRRIALANCIIPAVH